MTKPDHIFHREATIDIFKAGFGVGNLKLREFPFRNLSTMCFIMQVCAAKLYDKLWPPLPYNG
jgi:hypothetical protein